MMLKFGFWRSVSHLALMTGFAVAVSAMGFVVSASAAPFNKIISRDFSDPSKKTVVFGDGQGNTKTKSFALTNTTSKWSIGHTAKLFTYTYSDNTKRVVVVEVPPTIEASYNGNVQTIKKIFGDGYVVSTQTKAVSSAYGYNNAGNQKFILYTFKDGTSNKGQVMAGVPSAPLYSDDGSQKTPVYTFADGTSHNGPTLIGTPSIPSYSSDGLKKTIIYTFADGTTFNATILGAASTPSYSADGSEKTIVFSYSDGTKYILKSAAVGSQVSWSDDHITKRVIFNYADGSTHTISSDTQPISTLPARTASVYPSDWSSGNSKGTVTGPVTAPKQDVFADGFVKIYEDGSVTKPFLTSTLTPNGANGLNAINDPNAYVRTSKSGVYDLRWGTPDAAGPGYAANFNQGTSAYRFPQSSMIFGGVLSSSSPPCLNAGANVFGCGAKICPSSNDLEQPR